MRAGSAAAAALAALLAVLLVVPTGCGGSDGEKVGEIALTSIALQDSFALYYPVSFSATPRVPPYAVSPDLSGVAGVGALDVSPEARRMLGRQGFVAAAGESETLYGVYLDAKGAKFVTVEALLGTYRSLCAYALLSMEEQLAGELRRLVAALSDAVESLYRGGGPAVGEAAMSVLAYLGVAARLLGVEAPVPAGIEDTVDGEFELISDHAGTAISPFTGYREDYARYEPSGRYADGGKLEGYYKAMTWFGETGFILRPGEGTSGITAGRDMTRQALILVAALHAAEVEGESAYTVWDRIHQPVSFLAGLTAELDAYTYTRLMREVLGGSFSLDELEEDAVIDGFIDRASAEVPGGYVPPAAEEHAGSGASAAFRLFGRSDRPEEVILRRLVAPEVQGRPLPRGLDVPAAMGSDRALDILDLVYQETDNEGLLEGIAELRGFFEDADPARARSSSFRGCLDVMGLLMEPCGEGYPFFMQGEAWQDRGLYAFLGSLARMRHDGGILVADHAGEEPGEPGGAAVARGCVEPRPEAFARLAAITDMTRRGLEERGLAQPPVLERLGELNELLLELKTMAEKELRGEALSVEDYAVIDGIGHILRDLVTFADAGEGDTGLESIVPLPFVEDVWENREFGEVLQVGAGRPVIYYVIVPIEGRLTLAVGAGNSYYEFVKPAEGRFDERSWVEAVEAGQAPEAPAWTGSFLR